MKLSLKLKYLILAVAMISIIFTFLSSMISGYRMNKQNLIQSSLETNRVYAQKLASTTEVFFDMTLKTFKYSAELLAPMMLSDDRQKLLIDEAERLKYQTDTLNSIVIADANGEILATSPQTLDLLGKMLESEGGKNALREQRPLISKPYESITGRLIIFISYPIFDEQNRYLGLVGGTIYLMEDNVLNELLGDHFYEDGSYVYVVDSDGRIIYHDDPDRINDLADTNSVVQKVMNKESGAQRVINTKQVDMLAGFAHVPSSGWGVISQRPTEAALAANTEMIKQMVSNALPSLLLSILLIFFIARLIALPLQKLAVLTEGSTQNNQKDRLRRVKAWYYEAIQLKQALTYSLTFLHDKVDHMTHESQTDALTQLTNRRTMDKLLNKWISEKLPFSLIIVDIDHFKRVNDTYGHAVGDEVLIYLANSMKAAAEQSAVCCRYGGEEFVVLLPNANIEETWETAERLRLMISAQASPCGDVITISAGIAAYPDDADNMVDVFNMADQRLYEAKRSGRNQSNAGLQSRKGQSVTHNI